MKNPDPKVITERIVQLWMKKGIKAIEEQLKKAKKHVKRGLLDFTDDWKYLRYRYYKKFRKKEKVIFN